MKTPTYDEKIFEVLREFPNSTSEQVADLAMLKNTSVNPRLTKLFERGRVVREKDGKRFLYRMPDGNPPAPVIRRKPKGNGHSCPEEVIAQLRAQVRELVEWQRSAIARYPDLAVSERVLEMRRIVAKSFENDPAKARDARDGRLDNTPIAHAVLMALGEE